VWEVTRMNTAGTVIRTKATATGGGAECAADACQGRFNNVPVDRWPARQPVIRLNHRPQAARRDRADQTARRPLVRIELKGRRT